MWLQIRRARLDLTDYLIHWTRALSVGDQGLPVFDVLKKILECGYVKPSFAPRRRVTVGGTENTIKGKFPAVCFTEQPLDAFIKSCETLQVRYQWYGIVVHKWHLFVYGGRPVIYGDESLLRALPDDHKYLWVQYNPIPSTNLRYPLDWSHEREWRARLNVCNYGELGDAPPEGIPILLPPARYPKSQKPVLALPRILVKSSTEKDELKEWITHLPPYKGTNAVLRYFFEKLSSVIIVPIDEVKKHLGEGDTRYGRMETLPFKELYPSITVPAPENYL